MEGNEEENDSSSEGNEEFVTPAVSVSQRDTFDSVISDENDNDLSTQLNNLPVENLMDRLDQQADPNISAETVPATLSPTFVSPVIQNRSPDRSRSPVRGAEGGNPRGTDRETGNVSLKTRAGSSSNASPPLLEPTAARRLLSRLQDHNKPGLKEKGMGRGKPKGRDE